MYKYRKYILKILFIYLLFFKKDFIYLILERGREREIEEEKHLCVVASHEPPLGT